MAFDPAFNNGNACEARYDGAVQAKIYANAQKRRRDEMMVKPDGARAYNFLFQNEEFNRTAVDEDDNLIADPYHYDDDGYLIGLVDGFDRWVMNPIFKIRAEENEKAEYVGVVGKRARFELKVKKVMAFEGMYGITFINILKDDDDNTFVYKGTRTFNNEWVEDENGFSNPVGIKRVAFDAMVKAHEEYEGLKQTILARPTKIEVIEEKPFEAIR